MTERNRSRRLGQAKRGPNTRWQRGCVGSSLRSTRPTFGRGESDDGRLSPPGTLEEALAIRAAGPVTVLAGGTDVYPAKAARAGWGDMRHADILDISAVPDLRGIAEEPAAWRIGALTTWTDIIRAELPRSSTA